MGEKDVETGDIKEVDSLELEEKKTTWRDTCMGRFCVGFWSFIAFLLLLPLLIAFGLIAVIVWLVLAPFKCCCPCCAPCLTAVTETFFALAKIPHKLIKCICNIGEAEDEEEDLGSKKEKGSYGTNGEKEKGESDGGNAGGEEGTEDKKEETKD